MSKEDEWILLMFESAEVSKNTIFLEVPKNVLLIGALSYEYEVNMSDLALFMTIFKKNYLSIDPPSSEKSVFFYGNPPLQCDQDTYDHQVFQYVDGKYSYIDQSYRKIYLRQMYSSLDFNMKEAYSLSIQEIRNMKSVLEN